LGRRLRGSQTALFATLGEQVPPVSVPDSKTPIRMLISAFQDGTRCANTILRALQQAEHPERVSFNVLQAKGADDVDCFEEFKSHHLPKLCHDKACSRAVESRIHFWTIPPDEGKGPVHQRGLLSERADISGTDSMCLSTDSHMDFTEDWDRDLLEDWTATNNEFAVMTAYPLATSDAGVAGKQTWISLCGYFLEGLVPRGATGGTMSGLDNPGRPAMTMNWAAGQSFSRCHAEKNVPVDKNLMWIFTGEEVNRAVRLWTHGYDLYNPKVSVVLHNYTHAAQKFWSYASGKEEEEVEGSRRLHALLQGHATAKEFGRYGLGDQRSLDDYVTWSHTDLGGWSAFLAKKGINPLANKGSDTAFCQGLKRLPVRSAKELLASIAT